jgi:hypothetical protein
MEAKTKTPVNFEKVIILMKLTPMGAVNNCNDGPLCLKVVKTKDFFDQSLDEIKILELLRQTGKCHENNILEMRR